MSLWGSLVASAAQCWVGRPEMLLFKSGTAHSYLQAPKSCFLA